MGQKTNSNVLRLSLKKNEWKSKYIEKLSEDSTLFIHNDLEVRKYLDRFFHLHGLILHNCKINHSDGAVDIFICYFVTAKALKLVQSFKNTKISITSVHNKLPSNFTEILLESISGFTKKKVNVSFTFHNLNGKLSLKLNRAQISPLKKMKLQLKQFSRASFFKEAMNILFIVARKRQSSKLLAQFIAFQLSATKRHNYFLIFLKQALSLMLKSKFSFASGIKIVIKGRFNAAPRARSKTIQVGNISLQFFEARISYSQTTAYTPNGTFGIKVWICES
jgi:ribosomal protein S3